MDLEISNFFVVAAFSGQAERDHVVTLLRPQFSVPARRDHQILLAADAVSHRRGLSPRRQFVSPNLFPRRRLKGRK